MPRRYGSHFVEEATLADGTAVTLRAVEAGDRERLQHGFGSGPDSSRLERFFSDDRQLSTAELRYLTELDDDNFVGLSAVIGDDADGDAVAVARLIRYREERHVAEPAVAVVADMQRRGLGGVLFQHLVQAARERGIKRFRCNVLPDDLSARALIDELAPAAVAQTTDAAVVVEFDLAAVTPADDRSAYTKLLALVGDGAVRIRRAFPWLESF